MGIRKESAAVGEAWGKPQLRVQERIQNPCSAPGTHYKAADLDEAGEEGRLSQPSGHSGMEGILQVGPGNVEVPQGFGIPSTKEEEGKHPAAAVAAGSSLEAEEEEGKCLEAEEGRREELGIRLLAEGGKAIELVGSCLVGAEVGSRSLVGVEGSIRTCFVVIFFGRVMKRWRWRK